MPRVFQVLGRRITLIEISSQYTRNIRAPFADPPGLSNSRPKRRVVGVDERSTSLDDLKSPVLTQPSAALPNVCVVLPGDHTIVLHNDAKHYSGHTRADPPRGAHAKKETIERACEDARQGKPLSTRACARDGTSPRRLFHFGKSTRALAAQYAIDRSACGSAPVH
jgi:hypothetical protein